MLTIIQTPILRLREGLRRFTSAADDAPHVPAPEEREAQPPPPPRERGARTAACAPAEMTRLMQEHDRQRRRTYEKAVDALRSRGPSHGPGHAGACRAPAGGHARLPVSSRHAVGVRALDAASTPLQLARRSSTRIVGCAACAYPLCRLNDTLPHAAVAAQVSLEDCESTLATHSSCGVRLGEERLVPAHDDETSQWLYVVCSVCCPQCSVFVGVRVLSAHRIVSSHPAADARLCAILSRLMVNCRGVLITRPSAPFVHAQPAPIAPPRRRAASASQSEQPRQQPAHAAGASASAPPTPRGASPPPQTPSGGGSAGGGGGSSRHSLTPGASSSFSSSSAEDDSASSRRCFPRRSPRSPPPQPPPPAPARSPARADGAAGAGADGAGALAPAGARAAGAAADAEAAAAEPPAAPAPPPAAPVTPSVSRILAEHAAVTVRVQQTFLGLRYTRLLGARTHSTTLEPLCAGAPLCCAGCGSVLCYADQLLCTKRRWGFGGAPPEPACYVNSVVGAQVAVSAPYEEHLAQGLFEMAHVHCACGKEVGYKFVTDRSRRARNENQVGRFGLVTSCIALGEGGALRVAAAREAPALPLDARAASSAAQDAGAHADDALAEPPAAFGFEPAAPPPPPVGRAARPQDVRPRPLALPRADADAEQLADARRSEAGSSSGAEGEYDSSLDTSDEAEAAEAEEAEEAEAGGQQMEGLLALD